MRKQKNSERRDSKREIPRIYVAAGILWREDTLLVAKRPLTEPKAGYWEFPGGKQEPAERMEDTLIRELQEELGVTCTELIPFTQIEHDYPDMQVCLHLFHVTQFEGEPQPLLKQELRWVSTNELEGLNFLPADRQILRHIKRPL